MISVQSTSSLSLREAISRSPVAGMKDAEAILRQCIFRSIEVRYGFLDENLACMWGLIPPSLLSDTAYLWLLTTDIVAEHKFLFVRHSQRWIEEALKTYPTITGDVLVGNHPARRWLAWLGAVFDKPSGGRMTFVIRRKVLQ